MCHPYMGMSTMMVAASQIYFYQLKFVTSLEYFWVGIGYFMKHGEIDIPLQKPHSFDIGHDQVGN